MLATGYYVTAELRVNNETRVAEALDVLSKLGAITRTESGCRLFMVHQDVMDKRRLVLWEHWDDEAALTTHIEASHTKAYFELDLTELIQRFGTAAVL